VGLLKEIFLDFPLLPATDPREAFLQTDAIVRARGLPEKILVLIGKDADGYPTSLFSRVDRRIAEVASVGFHLMPRNRFMILAGMRAPLVRE
jgi:hypothetical protein